MVHTLFLCWFLLSRIQHRCERRDCVFVRAGNETSLPAGFRWLTGNVLNELNGHMMRSVNLLSYHCLCYNMNHCLGSKVKLQGRAALHLTLMEHREMCRIRLHCFLKKKNKFINFLYFVVFRRCRRNQHKKYKNVMFFSKFKIKVFF